MFGLIINNSKFKPKTEYQRIIEKCLIDTRSDTVFYILHTRSLKIRHGLGIVLRFGHRILSLFLGVSTRADVKKDVFSHRFLIPEIEWPL